MRFAIWTLPALILLFPIEVSAQWSFDIAAGVSRSVAQDPLTDRGTCCPPVTLDDEFSGTGHRFALGAARGPRHRFELGWTRFGDGGGTVRGPLLNPCVDVCVPPQPVEVFVRQRGNAVWAAYTPTLVREGAFEVAGRLGATRTTVESFTGDTPGFGESQDSTEFVVGLGVGWHSARGFGVRFDADRHGSTAIVVALSASLRF